MFKTKHLMSGSVFVRNIQISFQSVIFRHFPCLLIIQLIVLKLIQQGVSEVRK